jgi:hypothetical protein
MESAVDFIIDEELRLLIPPLTTGEYGQLEENIVKWGCLDPLKVWPVPDTDEVILLDGHNRYSICCDHNVNYDTESVPLIDRAAAIDWMIANPDGSNQHKEVAGHFDPQPPKSTAAKLAKEHGVSERTIKRDADYAKAVDTIVAATAPEIQQQLLGADSKFTKSAIVKLAKLAKEESGVLMEIREEVQQAPTKTDASAAVQRATSKIKETSMDKKTARLIDFETVGAGLFEYNLPELFNFLVSIRCITPV